jgi:hypothetical protein
VALSLPNRFRCVRASMMPMCLLCRTVEQEFDLETTAEPGSRRRPGLSRERTLVLSRSSFCRSMFGRSVSGGKRANMLRRSTISLMKREASGTTW